MRDMTKVDDHGRISRLRRTASAAVGVIVLLLAAATLLDAHDLFLKPARFFVAPNDSLRIDALNGTFTSSEAAVDRDRIRDLSLLGPDGLVHPPAEGWTPNGKASQWRLVVGKTGTYVLGASILPRSLRLDARDFNSYLEEDGLPDVLADRRSRGEMARPARERYSKHVKTLIQVGNQRSDRIDVTFGYPAELVPLANPYRLVPGRVLSVRALVDGNAMANQVVLAGGVTTRGQKIPERSVRTDGNGVARISLRASGVWYVKFIRMRRIDPAARDSVDYESKWATLTFAVR